MSRLPSEIEALLREVQGGDARQHHDHPQEVPLPYTHPGNALQYGFNASQQQQLSREHQSSSRVPTNRQALYQSQNLPPPSRFGRATSNAAYHQASRAAPMSCTFRLEPFV